MKPIHFNGANKCLTGDEADDLYVFNDGLASLSVWELTDEDIENLTKNRCLVLTVLSGETQPPVDIQPSITPVAEIVHKSEYVEPPICPNREIIIGGDKFDPNKS